MTAAQESCQLAIGFCEDEILDCVGMCVGTWAGFLQFGCVDETSSRLEKAEPSDGKDE